MPTDKERASCKTKKQYINDFAAQQTITEIRRKKGAGKSLRSYHCPVCFKYHLTSAPHR